MTFKERVDQYTTKRKEAEKALKKYLRATEIAETRKAEWTAMSEAASEALRGLKDETGQQ
jgi:hypothetical protein